MLTDQNAQFDVPADIAYFNTAYFGPRLHTVATAAVDTIGLTGRPWDVGPALFFDPVEDLRRAVAETLNADADGVALIPGISYGAGTAARNLSVGPGRTVILLAEQFPSNVYPWRAVTAAEGGDIVVVHRHPDGWTNAIVDAIDDRTAVVAVPNCHWTDGSIVDLVAVGEAARHHGAALCIDASQSFGALPLDVEVVQPDFVYSVGYKWQLGFYGLGYMWVAPAHRGGAPLEEGWAVRKDAENFSGLVDYTDVYEPGARRFDVGERSNFVAVAMNNAAMRQINEWGVPEIAASLRGITDAIATGAGEAGWVSGPAEQRVGHMIGLRHPNGLPDGLSRALSQARVIVSVRGDSVRVSPYLHTTDEDVDRLVAVLGSVV